MEVITIDSKAFQQLVEKVNLIADYVHEARLEQSTNSDEEWVIARLCVSTCASARRHSNDSVLPARLLTVVSATSTITRLPRSSAA